MTRINTNVSSLNAQKSLARSYDDLNQALTRLSTGLRINTGKDDPAGLIASEMLRSDIVGVQRGISNSHRANEMIATADSAIGQVSTLLNDIRGLVTEAANSGAMSPEMIAANQLQIDSSLEAIDRIAQTTEFQGAKLLDGTLAFTTRDVMREQITELRIDQANLGSQEELDVTVDVVGVAEKAKLNYPFGAIPDDVVLTIGGVDGFEAFTFDAGATIQEMAAAINLVSDATGVEAIIEKEAQKGHIQASSAGQNNDIVITANEAGEVEGHIDIKYVYGHDSGTNVDFNPSLSDDEPNTIVVEVQTQAYVGASVTQMDDANLGGSTTAPVVSSTLGSADTLTITGQNFGTSAQDYNIQNIDVVDSGADFAEWDSATGTLTVHVDLGVSTTTQVQASINALTNFNCVGATGAAVPAVGTFTPNVITLASGAVDNNALDITANLPGDQFNDTSVNIVRRQDINAASRADLTVPAAGLVEYGQDALESQMTLSGFANYFGQELLVQATTGGSAQNDVTFDFVDGGNGAAVAVQYTTDASGNKILQVTLDADTSTIQEVIDAVNNEGTFTVTDLGPGPGAAVVTTADVTNVTANTENTGGDQGTLFIYVQEGQTTALDVINAIHDPADALYQANARTRALFTVESSIDNDGSGLLFRNTHTNALTNGVTGGDVVATAQDVADQLNSTEKVKDLVSADIAEGNTGLSAVTVFEEYATYGQINDFTGLQFLGPADARNIRFVSEPDSELSVDFTTSPDQLAFATAELAAYNANASMRIQSVNKGDELNDAIVRFKRSETNTISSNVVTYDSRPSAAQAYLTFDTGGAAPTTNRNMIITAAEHGKWMNDVAIIMQIDSTLPSQTAAASFDPDKNTLTISVRNDTRTSDIMDALEKDDDGDGEPDSGFHAELDYSNNNTNNGSATGFDTWVTTQGVNNQATVANTGSTGGHEGGTIEVLVNSDVAADATAANIIAAINSDDIVNKLFSAEAVFTGYDNGSVNFLEDTNQMVTSGGIAEEGYMTVHLATDENGLVTTTAKDLVDYFNTLTAEQTNGVSVSLLQDDDRGNDGSGQLAATYPPPESGAGGSIIQSDGTTLTEEGHLEFRSEGIETVEAQATGASVARNGITAQITVTAVRKGEEYDGVVVEFDDSLTDPTADPVATYDEATKTLTVAIHPTQTKAIQVIDAINQDLESLFSAALTDPTVPGAGDEFVTKDDTATLTGGVIETGTANGAPFVGNEDVTDKGLTLQSVEYGSDAFVSIRALEGDFIVRDPDGNISERDEGVDVDLRLNSTQMVGSGRSAAMNTATLDLEMTVSEDVEVGQRLTFTITGGGARFQLGPEVVSNQQARLGISSINTTQMGGEAGKMFQLRTGGSADLTTNATLAFRIVEDSIVEVTELRGRLGAFQRTTIETNINALSDTLEALTNAESDIRDADFAEESAALTRAQILVQSGVSVLGIANQTPQNVLSLIRQ